MGLGFRFLVYGRSLENPLEMRSLGSCMTLFGCLLVTMKKVVSPSYLWILDAVEGVT